jgi:hypothetical protein
MPLVPPGLDLLSPEARGVLGRAKATPLSYGVRIYACPTSLGSNRLLVVLGEAHVKLARASSLGEEIVRHFDLRGVETFQRRRVIAGNALWVFIHVPRLVLRALSLGVVKGSTITVAKAITTGNTVELEDAKKMPLALHAASLYLAFFFFVLWTQAMLTLAAGVLPGFGDVGTTLLTGFTIVAIALEAHLFALVPALFFRRHSWSWIIHPAVGLITARDALMAEGTVAMLDAHRDTESAVVVMGRAHLPGYERELVTKHGFSRIGF